MTEVDQSLVKSVRSYFREYEIRQRGVRKTDGQGPLVVGHKKSYLKRENL